MVKRNPFMVCSIYYEFMTFPFKENVASIKNRGSRSLVINGQSE